jgi:hypothetical protein
MNNLFVAVLKCSTVNRYTPILLVCKAKMSNTAPRKTFRIVVWFCFLESYIKLITSVCVHLYPRYVHNSWANKNACITFGGIKQMTSNVKLRTHDMCLNNEPGLLCCGGLWRQYLFQPVGNYLMFVMAQNCTLWSKFGVNQGRSWHFRGCTSIYRFASINGVDLPNIASSAHSKPTHHRNNLNFFGSNIKP